MSWTEIDGSTATPTGAVIPYAPIINVTSSAYGAKGDGKVISDATISLSTPTVLTSVAARFTSSDVGKVIRVEGAGAASAALATTISAFTSTSQITLAAAASTAVTGVQAAWGTDDTGALRLAAAAVIFSGSTNNGNATIILDDGAGGNKIYLVTDTIDLGTFMDGLTITSNGWANVSGDGGSAPYHQTQIRWAGADATGKPIFWFKDNSQFNKVSHIGFVGGDEAIRFRKLSSSATVSGLEGNRVADCWFDDQQVSSIQFGFGVSDTTNDDDINRCLVENCIFSRTTDKVGHGIVLNASNNGYNFVVRGCQFSLGGATGARAVYIQKWNNVVIQSCDFLTRGGGTFAGTYPVEITSNGMGGTLHVLNCYAETPLLLLHPKWSGTTYTAGAVIENFTMNAADYASNRVPVDMTTAGPYLTLINATFTSGTATSRTIKFSQYGGAVFGTGLERGTNPDIYLATTNAPITNLSNSGGGGATAVPFSAGNFTSSAGTFVVASGDQTAFDYFVVGKKMTISFEIDTATITGTPATLRIALPAGVTAAKVATSSLAYSNNAGTWATGVIQVAANGTYLQLSPAGLANWADGADNNYLHGQITIFIK